jgi:hypothetical protein
MDAKIDGHLSRGAGELNAVKIELTGIKEKFDAVSARFNNEVNKWTVESGKLKKALSKGSSELRQVEEHIWDLRNIPGNILITQTQGLSADVELGDASRVKLTLGRMIATIQQNFVKKGKTLEEGDYAFLESRVKVAEAIAPIEVAEVLRRLDGVRPSAESRNADTSA